MARAAQPAMRQNCRFTQGARGARGLPTDDIRVWHARHAERSSACVCRHEAVTAKWPTIVNRLWCRRVGRAVPLCRRATRGVELVIIDARRSSGALAGRAAACTIHGQRSHLLDVPDSVQDQRIETGRVRLAECKTAKLAADAATEPAETPRQSCRNAPADVGRRPAPGPASWRLRRHRPFQDVLIPSGSPARSSAIWGA